MFLNKLFRIFLSNNPDRFTYELECVYYYFQFFSLGKFNKVSIKQENTEKESAVSNEGRATKATSNSWKSIFYFRFLRVGFYFTRFLTSLKFVYFTLLICGAFKSVHGSLGFFELLEVSMWMSAIIFHVPDYALLQNSSFLQSMNNVILLENRFWGNLITLVKNDRKLSKLRHSLQHNITRFAFHAWYTETGIAKIYYISFTNLSLSFAIHSF